MPNWVPSGLQITGLVLLVVGAGLLSIMASFMVAGVGLVLWGMALERGGD